MVRIGVHSCVMATLLIWLGCSLASADVITYYSPIAGAISCNDTVYTLEYQCGGLPNEVLVVDKPTAIAVTSTGTYGYAAPYASAAHPVGNVIGEGGIATANSSGDNQSATAAALVHYYLSSPGVMDLTFRAGAFGRNGTTTDANHRLAGGGEWALQIFPVGAKMKIGFPTTDIEIEPFQTGDPFLAFAFGSYSGAGGIVPLSESASVQSNQLPLGLLSPFADLNESITFDSKGWNSLDLTLWAWSYNGGWAWVDPIITPDAVNPDITVTSTSGPNPFPNTPLLSQSDLQDLPPNELQELQNIGVVPSVDAPEPSLLILVGTGLTTLLVVRRKRVV
jgi:hypothetical protein